MDILKFMMFGLDTSLNIHLHLLFILFGIGPLLCLHMMKVKHKKVKQHAQSHTITC